MKFLAPVAVGALVVGVVLTGWARATGRGADASPGVPPAGPSRTAPTQTAPTQAPPTQAPSINTDPPGPVGLDVRYLDSDGEVKHLGVKDFPR